MTYLKRFGIYLITAFLILCWPGISEAQKQDSIRLQRINAFFTGYNQLDYKLIRKQLGGPTKMILTKGLLKKLFEPQFQLNGPVIDQLVSRSTAKSIQMNIRYGKDSTEWQPFGFVFNKKNKIVGLRLQSPSFRFPLSDSITSNRSREERIAAMDSSFQLKMRTGVFEGCVFVADAQGEMYKNCSGFMTDTTVFELASVSKQFTAVATLQLVAAGKLALDQEVRTYISEFPYSGVTVRMLLNHCSGLPDYMELIEKRGDKKRIATNADMLALLVKYKPKVEFKPGKKHSYSNTGYAVLACLIERVSGRSFADQLQQSIFVPAGMTKSRVYHRRLAGEIPANLAVGKVWSDSLQRYAVPDSLSDYDYVYYLDGIAGDGCVNSTIVDLQKWVTALKSGVLLPDTLLELAWQPTILENGDKHNYGFGWTTDRNEKQIPLIHHSGSWPGYTTFILFPYDRAGLVIVLTNNDYQQVMSFSRNLTGWMLDRK